MLGSQLCQLDVPDSWGDVVPDVLGVADVSSRPDGRLGRAFQPLLKELRDGLPFRGDRSPFLRSPESSR